MPEDLRVAEVKTALHELIEAVREGTSPERINRLVEDVMDKREGMASRRSFDVDDVGGPRAVGSHAAAELAGLQGRDRLKAIHTADARAVADTYGLRVGDVRELQERADELLILSAYLQLKDPTETAFYRDVYQPVLHAMDTATAAEGQEFVPTALSGTLIERVNLALLVANLFPTIDPMPTNPYNVPGLAVSRQRTGMHAEQTADTGQTKIKKITPATRQVVLTAKKFAVEALLSSELDEDSLIPVLPYLRAELVDFLAADVEDCTINGDTAGTHQDYDTTAADDPRKNWDGLRKRAIAGAKTDASGAALTVAMLRKNRGVMGRYGTRSDDLAHIVSTNSYVALLSDPAVFTMEKYGPNATILTGELGKLDNVPIIVSEYVRTDLNATGVNDQTAANNTKTIALTVSRRGWLNGIKRSPTITILRELYAESDQLGVIASVRRAFQARFPTATEKIAALHYNVLS